MPAVLSGIVTIADADAMSDALGIHIAEESKNYGNTNEVWASTIATFTARFVIAGTFSIPVLLMPLDLAIAASLVWSFSLLIEAALGVAGGDREGAGANVFTTHTPVPAGHDQFPADLARRVLGSLYKDRDGFIE